MTLHLSHSLMMVNLCPVVRQPVHRKLDQTSGLVASGLTSWRLFDVRVTHPKPSFLSQSEFVSQLRQHEQMKKRQYCARVNQIDWGTGTPLILSTAGMRGSEASIFLKSLRSLICKKKHDLHPPHVIGQLRCRNIFKTTFTFHLHFNN